MKAIVFHGVGDVRLEDVKEPKIKELVEMVRTSAVDLTKLLSQHEPIGNAVEAYKEFDRREPRWVKVELRPQVH